MFSHFSCHAALLRKTLTAAHVSQVVIEDNTEERRLTIASFIKN